MPHLLKETVKQMIDDACAPLLSKISELVIQFALERDQKNQHASELLARDNAWYDRADHLELMVNSVARKITDSEKTFNHVKLLEEKMTLLERKCDDIDQYSRRLNLIVDGIPIRRNDSPSSILKTIRAEATRLKLPINDWEICRAHRTSSAYIDDYGVRQQAVIVRFVGWSARDAVYQARHDSKFRYRADLTYERQSTLTYCRNRVETDDAVAAAIKYVFADRNCRMQASCTNGRLLSFSTTGEFENLLHYIESTDEKNRLEPRQFHTYQRNGGPDSMKDDMKEWESGLPRELQPRSVANLGNAVPPKPSAAEIESVLATVRLMTSPTPSPTSARANASADRSQPSTYARTAASESSVFSADTRKDCSISSLSSAGSPSPVKTPQS